MYMHARKEANLSREEAAFKLHVGTRTLAKYEAGETVPPPEVVLAMSRLYKIPWLTQHYCKQNCAIGKAYSYEVLNAVNLDLASVILKLTGEMKEAEAVLAKMLELAVNKNSRSDFSDQEWAEFVKCLHEFIDVEHNVETLKISLGQWVDVSELVKEHNDKCYRHGYVVTKKKSPAVPRINVKYAT